MPGFNLTAKDEGYDNGIETARKHRWKVSITIPDEPAVADFLQLSIISFFAKSCNVPSVSYDELVVHNGQDKIVLPGKWNYKPVDIVFYEILKSSKEFPSGEYSLSHQLMLLTPNSARFSKINNYYRFNTKIEMLNGRGATTTTYELHECYIEKFEPSDLDYSDTNISELTLTLKYNRYTVK